MNKKEILNLHIQEYKALCTNFKEDLFEYYAKLLEKDTIELGGYKWKRVGDTD